MVSKKLATLHELQSVYGAPDLYDLYEVIVVDNYNARKMAERDS